MADEKIRMKVLEPFTERLNGQIVSGHPKHPDPDGRFVFLDREEDVALLESRKVAKRYSAKDEAKEEIEGDFDPDNRDDATLKGTGATETAQGARDRRTSTGGPKRRKPPKGKPPAAGDEGGAPTGGTDTIASTNHATSNTDGAGVRGETGIVQEAPGEAPDAAPTGGNS